MLTNQATFLIPKSIIILQLICRKNTNTSGIIQNLIVDKNKTLFANFSKVNSKENYIFMIRMDGNFCDQILKTAAMITLIDYVSLLGI